jgi:hypothetical protein
MSVFGPNSDLRRCPHLRRCSGHNRRQTCLRSIPIYEYTPKIRCTLLGFFPFLRLCGDVGACGVVALLRQLGGLSRAVRLTQPASLLCSSSLGFHLGVLRSPF